MLKPSGTAAARAAAKAVSATGLTTIDLTAGEIWAPLSSEVSLGAIAAINDNVARYTDTAGLEELRTAIAIKLGDETGLQWGHGDVVVTSGAKQALFNAAMVLLDPGDEVLIPGPYWTTFPAQCQLTGATPVTIDTRATGFLPRAEDVRRLLTPRTKAIILNTPCNPTGAVYDRKTLSDLAEIALEHRLWVIFDECYSSFTYDGNEHVNLLALEPRLRDQTVLINAFSKSLAMTGWRIGYMAAPPPVISAAKALQGHTTSNANVIAQHGVLRYLRSGGAGHQERLFAMLAGNRDTGRRVLGRLENVRFLEPQGGFYFYLDIAPLLKAAGGGLDVDLVVQRLLAKAGVAAVSGSAFGDDVGVRLSYGVPGDLLEAGLERLVQFFNTQAYLAP
jgi:aspartate aminotransferase